MKYRIAATSNKLTPKISILAFILVIRYKLESNARIGMVKPPGQTKTGSISIFFEV